MTYQASPIKRYRATRAQMEARAKFLINYAKDHRPVTVRDMVREAIERDLPAQELEHLKRFERAERETLLRFIGGA